MSPHSWQPVLQQRLDTLLCWLLPLFLLVDCVNGALLQLYGSSYGLSALYKLVLLAAMALATWLYRPGWVLALALLLLLMLTGPALHWPQLALRWMLADVQLAVKVLSPLLAFGYFIALRQRAPQQSGRLLRYCLALSALVVLGNALLGALGFGFSAYQPLDGVAQSFLGIKGFFYSTNELSAVLLLLSCALLCLSWPAHKAAYAVIAIIAVLLALSLLTKTGLFGVLLLVLLVPLLLQDAQFWRRQKTRLLLLALSALVILLLAIINAETLLRALGIYDKLSFVYQQRGISGIVLSSRDYYASRIWQSVAEHYPDWQRWLGVGQGGVALHLKKYFAELDWFDITIFYGAAGLGAVLVTFAVFIRHSWQHCGVGAGRVLLLLNLLLLVVSSLAGHILTSGMVWLLWALCNALLLQGSLKRRDNERSA
jgi:hypothetical protein